MTSVGYNSLQIANLKHKAQKSNNAPLWQPNPDRPSTGSGQVIPNPQRLALESEADELFYGGAAGGGKTDLLLGCGFTQHRQAVIFRRLFPNLRGVIERSVNLIGRDDLYNKTEKIWRINNRLVEFGSVQYENDKKNWQGRPHDFYGFDEITEFTRTQYLFIIGWNRTTIHGQRCRVICTGNPPIDEAGSWIVQEWQPWLDNEFHEPARPGELRWYYYEDDRIIWLKSPEPIEVGARIIKPRSRTFIPARLSDNPHLSNTGYESVLHSMPEPYRTMLLEGDFSAAKEIDPWQVIPTDWVRLAQKRWLDLERPDTPLTAVGIDVARGGRDKTTIAKRYDNWFDAVLSYPGAQTPNGPTVAVLAKEHLESDPANINIDVIGVGSSAYDSLEPMYPAVSPFNGAERSDYRDRSGKLAMRNKRAEMYWRMRDALDPTLGDEIALPPGNELLADLCAARYKPTTAGIIIEEKDEIKARIGRSPDVGEAIMLANMPTGILELEIVRIG